MTAETPGKKELLIALTGNPNSGKTTVFNALTGSRQNVGNYPGVTVEKKEGFCHYGDRHLRIVDLPGTYSLTSYSEEEKIARRFILEERPDAVVDIVDSSRLERSLYLAVQLMEMQVPLILVFNMSDVALQNGLQFDLDQLSILLGAPIVPMVASKKEGIDELLKAIVRFNEIAPRRVDIHYGKELDEEIDKIEALLNASPVIAGKYPRRWLALKMLEGDSEIADLAESPQAASAVEQSRKHIQTVFRDTPDIIIADRRYGFISGACQETIKTTVEVRHDRSDKIDAVLLHSYFGLPIFAGMMFLVFFLTFRIGAVPMAWLESLFGWTARLITDIWPQQMLLPLRSLIVDGIIGGVGGVVVFLPNILLLFLGIAFLEDTGYMARSAFLMDRIMHKVGLHGKSFIPMLIGFGCSVPAIMATRILENRRTRLATMMVIPLMSCGARITIYSLIIPAFFPLHWRGPIMWLIYFIGIVLAVVCVTLLRKTILQGETIPFVMELPPYRMPTLHGLLIHMWDRSWMYLKKAGTVILGISIILWAASSFPRPAEDRLADLDQQQQKNLILQNSLLGRTGKIIEPLIRPIGFDWKIATALLGATAAKEVFVSQLGIVYSLGENDQEALRTNLQRDYTKLQGFCILIFSLISAPCVATVAITRKESGAWKWAILQYAGLTLLAWLVTFVIYQAGSAISLLAG